MSRRRDPYQGPLPTAAARWAQVLNIVSTPRPVEDVKAEADNPDSLDAWTRKLARALNVRFDGRPYR